MDRRLATLVSEQSRHWPNEASGVKRRWLIKPMVTCIHCTLRTIVRHLNEGATFFLRSLLGGSEWQRREKALFWPDNRTLPEGE